MMKGRVKQLVIAAVLAAGSVEAKTALDVPVSGVTNKMYLSSAATRPWWNTDWARRAPLLVSSMADIQSGAGWVDCVVDFGETVNPDEIRLVTMWETEIPCVAEKVDGGRVRLIFQLPLRIRENKPLLVYWGNPKAEKPTFIETMNVTMDGATARLANGRVELTIDRRQEAGNTIKGFRLVGSQTGDLVTLRATGAPWKGFTFATGRSNVVWKTCRVTADNPFKKQVTLDAPEATLVWTMYPGQPRADYAYTLKRDPSARIVVAWCPGGGAAWDDFYYTGLTGARLTFRGSLDEVTDSGGFPHNDHLEKWMKEGWYAICDRKNGDTAGMVYDRASLARVSYGAAHYNGGERVSLTFEHASKKGESLRGAGSGALVGTFGGADQVAAEYARLVAPPQVFLGKAESCRTIPIRLPDHTKDFMGEFVTGMNPGNWEHLRPGTNPDWADNAANYLRRFGATAIRLTGYGWQELCLTEDLYNRCKTIIREDPKIADHVKNRPIADWSVERYAGVNLRKVSEAAHRKGLGVSTWTGRGAEIFGGLEAGVTETPLYRQLVFDLQNRYPKSGAGVVYNSQCSLEGPWMPKALRQERGNEYWRWEKPEDFFNAQDDFIRYMKAFYAQSKRENPKTPVFVFSAENGGLNRELPLADLIGAFDAEYCELVPGYLASAQGIKHSVRRLRSHFDNNPHTAFHHFYYYTSDHGWRISQLEVPFAFGVNGFSHEVMMHDTIDVELNEITGDFYRFAEYTRLGGKVSKMAPVKHLAVLRDARLFRENVLNKRPNEQESRLRGFAALRNYPCDIVANPFFTCDSLKRYTIVYVPDNRVFTDEQAAELLAYVEAGGNAIVEGVTGEKVKGLVDGEITVLGKGKIVWSKEVLSEQLAKDDASKVLPLLRKLGGEEPYSVKAGGSCDGLLQASGEGFFYAAYNVAKHPSKGRFVMKEEVRKSLFVLNVRTGGRKPFDGSFEFEVGAQQCGFWLIGDEAFTAVPEAKACVYDGASAVSAKPAPVKLPQHDVEKAKAFKELEIVEVLSLNPGFLGYQTGGEIGRIDRHERLKLKLTRFYPDEKAVAEVVKPEELDTWKQINKGLYNPFDETAFAKALKTAKVLYLRGSAAQDLPFVRCPQAVKDFLAGGGGIIFDCLDANTNVTAFLKSVGVEDPMAAGRFVKSCGQRAVKAPGLEHPIVRDTNERINDFNREGFCRYHLTGGGWKGWSKDQFAPVRAFEDPEQIATVIVQENVCGKGRVVFSRNWNAWWSYRSSMCDGLLSTNILSWLFDYDVNAYESDLQVKNGGPGEVVGEQ